MGNRETASPDATHTFMFGSHKTLVEHGNYGGRPLER
jgi:hypothetical protein